jgi:alpha-glucosidase (family GH31 glycosyl hydrolase)
VLRHHDDVAKRRYFGELLAGNRRQGPHTWSVGDLDPRPLGRGAAMVTVRWRCRRPDGSTIWEFLGTYLLAAEQGRWRILGRVHVVDWTNPEAVRVMAEEYQRLFATGAARGERERIAWSRSGWAGAQRYPVHWGGDVPPAWETMLPQPHGGLSLGLSGFTFWSADIGGTGEPPADQELLIRWLQWAVLLSHPRVHGTGECEPCRWPDPARLVARDWIRLRYRLLPYVLAEAADAAGRGLPFARPLVLEFPDDPTTWRLGDQFLCGRSILAAPLFEPGGRRRVYLPADTWTDWWTRRRVRGPRWLRAGHGLDTMPLFLREGAVVPVGPVTRHVGERPTDPLTVLVAPFQRAGRTELRMPLDGREVTIRYQAGAGRHQVMVDGHPGQVLLDAPAGVELRP